MSWKAKLPICEARPGLNGALFSKEKKAGVEHGKRRPKYSKYLSPASWNLQQTARDQSLSADDSADSKSMVEVK